VYKRQVDITGATLGQTILADRGGILILRNCTVTAKTSIAIADSGFIDAYNTTFSDNVTNTTGGILNADTCVITGLMTFATGVNVFNNCLLTNLQTTSITGSVTYNECRVADAGNYNGILNASYTLFMGGGDHLVEAGSGGIATVNYCIFKPDAAKFGFYSKTGNGATSINNCTFVDDNKDARGVITQINLTINNCIFSTLQYGIYQDGSPTVISNNSCLYNNTTSIQGTVTQNASQTGNPNLTDVANNNFSLGAGSSCDATGTDLGATYQTGISSANWGNGSTTTPVVTTTTQSASWDIGAYILE